MRETGTAKLIYDFMADAIKRGRTEANEVSLSRCDGRVSTLPGEPTSCNEGSLQAVHGLWEGVTLANLAHTLLSTLIY